ncbi:MAG: AAC(3) family N-acetyltransferase [Xanthobacteraceae bacterium]
MDVSALSEQLMNFGLVPGDVLYLRAALKPVGLPKGETGSLLLGAIFDVLGPEGTLIVPAFVRQYPVWKHDIPISDENLRPNTGALSDIVLAQPGVVRSRHPTHSFAGLGPAAHEILDGHSGEKSAFEPMRKIAARNGLMMLIGCVDSSPGFSTVHLAQFDLGLTQQHYLRHIFHVRLPDADGRRHYYRPIEAPGCSMSFSKFYDMYEGFRRGKFGEAEAISVRAGPAFDLETRTLAKDPLFIDCGDPHCLSCNARGYNKWALPALFLRAIPYFTIKALKR